MNFLPVKEFRRLDRNSEEMGVPVRDLMANAGKALAAEVLTDRGPVQIMCGKGNNGGDGYACAEVLVQAGVEVQVVAVEPPKGRESRYYRDRLPQGTVSAWDAWDRDAEDGGVVVDCLLGSGITGAPRPPYDAVVAWIDERQGDGATVVSCDVPSGLGSDQQVTPDITVTFHAAKDGMQDRSGKIVVADIGIPPEAEARVGVGDLEVGFPRRDRQSHKGENGRVLVVGGGPFLGAPHYSGMAAYRTGADLVHLCTTAGAASTIASWGPDLLVHAVTDADHLEPSSLSRILAHMDHCDAVLLGPGVGTHDASRDLAGAVLDACAQRGLPVVVDADGLDAVTPEYLEAHGDRTLLTPHGKEFEDLGNDRHDRDAVVAYAKEHGVVVLRKGAVDVVACATRAKECHRGHPVMTVGGTGDVLAGAGAALVARGVAPFDAACAAAYLVGVAGETAAARWADGATATDVLEAIPSVLVTRLYGDRPP